jgi:hypothetical protein
VADPQIVVSGVKLTAAERGMKRSPWRSIRRDNNLQWFAIGLAPYIPVIYLLLALDVPPMAAIVAVVLAMLGVAAAMLLSRRLMARIVHEMDRTPAAAEGDDWRIDANAIHFGSPSAQSSLHWRALVDVHETVDVFHFVMTPAQIFVLPKRCLGNDDISLLRTFVQSARERGDLKGVSDD